MNVWKYPKVVVLADRDERAVKAQIKKIRSELAELQTELKLGNATRGGHNVLLEFCDLEQAVETLGRMLHHRYHKCPAFMRELVKIKNRKRGYYGALDDEMDDKCGSCTGSC